MFVREEKEKFRSQEREKRKERREKREEPPLFFWFELGCFFWCFLCTLFCTLSSLCCFCSHPFLFVKKDVCFRARRESEKKDSTTKNVVPSKRAFVIYCSLYIDYLDKERQGYNTKRN